MLIEFVSPPGSGKTTVYKTVLRATRASYPEYRPARDLTWVERKSLRLRRTLVGGIPFFGRNIKDYCSSNSYLGTRAYVDALLADMLRLTLWQKKCPPQQKVLFDQAVAQQFLSLCMRSKKAPEALLQSYNALTPRADAIVTVEVPVEEALSRMRSRSYGPPPLMSRKSDAEILEMLHIADHACRVLVSDAERGGQLVIRCDGTEPPEVSARKILDVTGYPQTVANAASAH